MKNFLKTFLTIVYSAIAIAITVLLLSYNGYKCSVINGYTFYMLQDDMNDTYVSGDLLIIKGTNADKLEEGDEVFLYNNISSTEFEVVLGKIEKIEDSGTRKIITIDDGTQFDSQYLIGKASTTKSYHKLGTVLSILESRWGYLFCIVVVTLLILLQEVMDLFVELRYNGEEKKQQKIEKNRQYQAEQNAQNKIEQDEDEQAEQEEQYHVKQRSQPSKEKINLQSFLDDDDDDDDDELEKQFERKIEKKSVEKNSKIVENRPEDKIKKKNLNKSGETIKKKSSSKSGEVIKKKSAQNVDEVGSKKSVTKHVENGEHKKRKPIENDENL